MKFMKRTLGAALAGCLVLSANSWAAGFSETPWNAYFGSNEPAEDWSSTGRIDSESGLTDYVISTGRDVVVTHLMAKATGSTTAGTADYLNMVKSGGVAQWQQTLRERAIEAVALQAGGKKVYWAFENEINSSSRSTEVHTWAGANTGTAKANDAYVIPIYVEYFLAPGVAALRNAEAELGTDFPVVLGSLANAYNPEARAWLYSLLNYKIVGTYAPEFAGLKVSDIVDRVAIHYLVSGDNHFKSGKRFLTTADSWKTALDEVRKGWLGVGAIRGIWATEELGRQRTEAGYGATTAVKVVARNLRWLSDNNLTADQSRSLFWGTDLGGSNAAIPVMEMLGGFLEKQPLRSVSSLTGTDTNLYENYLFETVSSDRRVAMVVPRTSSSTATISALTVPSGGWTGITSAELHVYGLAGHRVSTLQVVAQSGSFKLVAATSVKLSSADSAVVLIRR